MVHIKLITIKRQLQAKMNYPTEPDPWGEYLSLDEAFDELLFAFGNWLERSEQGVRDNIYKAKKRGWMSSKQADLFTEYCIKGWRVV